MKLFTFYFKRDDINVNDFSIAELHNSVILEASNLLFALLLAATFI